MISGNVNFVNNSLTLPNSCAASIYLNASSMLNIMKGANVVFLNNTVATVANYGDGGAVYLFSSKMIITGHVSFINSVSGGRGGAIALERNSSIEVETAAQVCFINNTALYGGAISSYASQVWINAANVSFIENVASLWGGAVHFFNSNFDIEASGSLKFINNTAATQGGAMIMTGGVFHIGGSKLLVFNNHASQGGGLYLYSSYLFISFNVSMSFINNTAREVGGLSYICSGSGIFSMLLLCSMGYHQL